MEFRTEMFNAFNHVRFMDPDDSGFSGIVGQVSQRGPGRLGQSNQSPGGSLHPSCGILKERKNF